MTAHNQIEDGLRFWSTRHMTKIPQKNSDRSQMEYSTPRLVEYGTLRDVTLNVLNGKGKNDNAQSSNKTS
ncbi:lasso RiPP family leader peptide-containing protein [Porphyrobacter sp. SLTP]|nr:lasso RiPP family leader peptide-containing protein [Porphyrobacter sp. SLTP]